ncbi:MAG: hypothetical protein KDA96_09260 [Planctomycetaceae bacterium]|nr:hypothetical protein [Planctomycetaceae bacterium]
MDRPQGTSKRANLMLSGLLTMSSLVGCAYHNLYGGGNVCGQTYGAGPGVYGGAPGVYQPGGSGAAVPPGGSAPYYQPPARPPGSGFFGSGGY